ncbi:MAG: glycosyltransferase, partial [bacterium]|nr:glycosyltransferase [bacterium]
MSKKISVVIPAYNEEDYLGTTLDALSDQTLPRSDFEIIVVD